jgi:UDP-glucose 4,6-dehydratase
MFIEANKKITLHGDGSNKRSYVYVKDAADAFITILHKGKIGEIYNIGSDDEYSNLQVACTILKLLNKPLPHDKTNENIIFVEDRPFNDIRYHINSNKVHELGWIPSTSWENGILETIEWYQKNSQYFGDVTGVLIAHPRINSISSYL